MIIAFLEQDHRDYWDVHLKDFHFAYNTAHHSSIGASLAFVNLGRELESAYSLRRRCWPVAEGGGSRGMSGTHGKATVSSRLGC